MHGYGGRGMPMINRSGAQLRRSSMAGFSLIELMVGMVLGLIVVSAVITLVLSIIQSNNRTIQATRLTQELRATAAVIAADVKRARGVGDPFETATQVGGNPFRAIDAATAGCLRYAYDNAPGGRNFHTISLSNGSVMFADATAQPACGAGERLNSPFITISALSFVQNGRSITVTLTGALDSAPEIQRTITQTIFIRSLAGT